MLETPDKKAGGGMPVGTVVFALAAVVGVASGYFLYQDWMDRAPLLPQLTEEAKAYLPQLELSDIGMKAEESFLQQTIVSIEGKLTNQGTRVLRAVDIHCVFSGTLRARNRARAGENRGAAGGMSFRPGRRGLSVWLSTMCQENGTRCCRICISRRWFSRTKGFKVYGSRPASAAF